MKKLLILSALCLFCMNIPLYSQVNFDDYFYGKTLRFDYIRAGNSAENQIYFEQLKIEPYWSGNPKSLIDRFNYGHYKYLVFDKESGKLIYSRGYNTLYDEWQSTPEAKELKRAFYETVVFPLPKKPVRVELHERKSDGRFVKQYEITVDPDNMYIVKENPKKYNTVQVVNNGTSSVKADIVFLPDGYTKDEMGKFIEDAKKYAGYLLECSPFKEYSSSFNFWAVEAPSDESGVDVPGQGIWKNSIINSSFYSLDVERYLMTMDIRTVRDLAASVPYDNICIISNTAKYGGGAIYNYYTSFPNENSDGAYLIVHEFGHHFCALGDEYYTSQVSVEEYYKFDVEPYEPNLTTLVDFDRKWKDMLEEGIPIPTPSTPEYKDRLGVFEGGGYVAKGVYRPKQDCTMKSRTYNNFCPVCTKALIEMIKYYSD